MIAEYHQLGQFSKEDVVIDNSKPVCWHVNLVFFTLSLTDQFLLSQEEES